MKKILAGIIVFNVILIVMVICLKYCFDNGVDFKDIDFSKSYLKRGKLDAFDKNELWIDFMPEADDNITCIKWVHNYNSKADEYHLYIPKNELLEFPVYSNFRNLKINDTILNNGDVFLFEDNKTYQINDKYQLTIKQCNAPSMFIKTDKRLRNGTSAFYKNNYLVTDGKIIFINGEESNSGIVQLDKITTRGHGSLYYSMNTYGKYSFNVKLDKGIKLFESDNKIKSFCMIANNEDISKMRNSYGFEVAKIIGLQDVPQYKFANLYSNGIYYGVYLLTEKVDVGKNKLVTGNTMKDYRDENQEKITFKNDILLFDGQEIQYRYANVKNKDSNIDFKNKAYLLEFDFKDRAIAEDCYFETPKEQYISIKEPKDLNKEEMEFVIKKWLEVETAVYKDDFDSYSKLLDVDSFVKMYILSEISKNIDSGASSYFVYYNGEEENPKWKATPVWDYDKGFGCNENTRKIINIGTGDIINGVPNDFTGFFAKYKSILLNDFEPQEKEIDELNFQAKLVNNSNVWSVVKEFWNDYVYNDLQDFLGEQKIIENKCDTLFSNIHRDLELDNDYYGFSKIIPKQVENAVDTGDNVLQSYEYLKEFLSNRLEWLNDNIE